MKVLIRTLYITHFSSSAFCRLGSRMGLQSGQKFANPNAEGACVFEVETAIVHLLTFSIRWKILL